MIKKYSATLLFVLFLMTSYSQMTITDFPEKLQSIIKEKFDNFPDSTQVSIALIDNNVVKYYGVEKLNNQIIAVENKNSVFEIGSITKVFTSALLSNSIMKGDLLAETKVDKILGYSLKDSFDINLLQLSNHTAGLARIPGNMMMFAAINPDNPYQQYNKELLIEYLQKYIEQGEQNTTSNYSNLGAGLLAYCLTIHYQKTFEELLQENIFTPFNMIQSSTDINKVKKNLVRGFKENGSHAHNWDMNVLEGAGAILSTSNDLVLFLDQLISKNHDWLNKQLEATAIVNDNMKIGMAWHIIKQSNGANLYWHNGGTGGYTSSFMVDVKNKRGMIILSNVSAFSQYSKDIETIGLSVFNR
ncbi:MAG: serine hydrolase domain-containing protein [Saprospiraceae bacterium]